MGKTTILTCDRCGKEIGKTDSQGLSDLDVPEPDHFSIFSRRSMNVPAPRFGGDQATSVIDKANIHTFTFCPQCGGDHILPMLEKKAHEP